MAQTAQATVIRARGGTICDTILEEMIQLAKDMENGTLTYEGGTLLLQNLRPVLEELATRRHVMETVRDACNLGNVAPLPRS